MRNKILRTFNALLRRRAQEPAPRSPLVAPAPPSEESPETLHFAHAFGITEGDLAEARELPLAEAVRRAEHRERPYGWGDNTRRQYIAMLALGLSQDPAAILPLKCIAESHGIHNIEVAAALLLAELPHTIAFDHARAIIRKKAATDDTAFGSYKTFMTVLNKRLAYRPRLRAFWRWQLEEGHRSMIPILTDEI